MNKAKINFISELLTYKGISVEEKEKIFALTKSELEKLSSVDEVIIKDILERIKRLEGEKQSAVRENGYPIIHDAPKLIELLRTFTSNSKVLKYTTHSWEYGKFESYDDFMKKVSLEWREIVPQLSKLNFKLYSKISNFLLHDKLGELESGGKYISWGEKFLKFGWSSPALKDYMSTAGRDPFACPIPDNIKKLDKKYSFSYFKDYITVFKNEIEIREDSNALETLLYDMWENALGYDFKLNLDPSVKGVSFFTDVPYLKSTIELILKNCASRPQHPTITISIEPNFLSKYLILKIEQKDSICNRHIDDPKILKPIGGDLGSIIKNLENLADFSIISRFRDEKIYKVNYLSSNSDTQGIEVVNNCHGFTYEIRLYL